MINGYERFVKPTLQSVLMTVFGYVSTCSHRESCSRYTIRMIKERGTITGLILGGKRLSTCIRL